MGKTVHVHLHNRATRDAWEESKHPRDKAGKFGEGGAEPRTPAEHRAASNHHLSEASLARRRRDKAAAAYHTAKSNEHYAKSTAPASAPAAAGPKTRGAEVVAGLPGYSFGGQDVVDIGAGFGGLMQGAQFNVPPSAYSEASVPLKDLLASQEGLQRGGLAWAVDNPGKAEGLPTVVRLPDGRLVVQDGHHRLAAAKLRGESSALVKVARASRFDESNMAASGWSVK